MKSSCLIVVLSLCLACTPRKGGALYTAEEQKHVDSASITYRFSEASFLDRGGPQGLERTACEKMFLAAQSLIEGNIPDSIARDQAQFLAQIYFEKILRECPAKSHMVLDWNYDCDSIDLHIESNFRLSKIYASQEENDKALACLDVIERQNENVIKSSYEFDMCAPLDVLVQLYRIELYKNYFNEPEKALTVAQQIIKQHKAVEVYGFEWNSIASAHTLFQMKEIANQFAINDDVMIHEYTQAFENTADSLTKVLAAIEKANLLVNARKYDEAVGWLRAVLEQYPDVSYASFKYVPSYSARLVCMIFDALYHGKKDLDQTLLVMNNIVKENEGKYEHLTFIADYFINLLKDLGAYPEEEVKNSYKSFLRKYPHTTLEIYMPGIEVISSEQVRKRLNDIESFVTNKAAWQTPEFRLKAEADSTSRAVMVLKKGDQVTTLYRHNTKKNWYKIKTSEGRYGWARAENLKLINASYFSKNEKYSSWSEVAGNAGRTRHIEGRRIKVPKVIAFFQDVNTFAPLFYDINRDGVPELFIDGVQNETGKPEMACIDGTIPYTVWTIPDESEYAGCTGFSNGFIKENILYKGCYAVDVKTGKLLWTTGLGHSAVLHYQNKIYWVWNHELWSEDQTQPSMGGDERPIKKIAPRFNEDIDLVVNGRIVTFVPEPYQENPIHEIQCIDENSLKLIWTVKVKPQNVVLSNVIDGKLFVVYMRWSNRDNYTTTLTYYNLKDGTLLSEKEIKAGGDMVLVKDRLFILEQNSIKAFDTETATLQWQSICGPIETGFGKRQGRYPVCGVGNSIYIGSTDGNIYCLDRDTGKRIWKFNVGASIQGSISAAGPVLAVKANNNLYLIGD